MMFFFHLLSLLPLLALQIANVAGSPVEIRASRGLTAGCTKTAGWSAPDWNPMWALRRQLCSGKGTFQAQYGYKTGGDMQVKLNGKLQKAGIYLAMIYDINEAEAGGSGKPVFPEAECYRMTENLIRNCAYQGGTIGQNLIENHWYQFKVSLPLKQLPDAQT